MLLFDGLLLVSIRGLECSGFVWIEPEADDILHFGISTSAPRDAFQTVNFDDTSICNFWGINT